MLQLLLATAALGVMPVAEDSRLNRPEGPQIRLRAELGALATLRHTIRLGRDGTRLDYRRDLGQDVAFPYQRYSADLDLGARHTFVLLWQPLDLRSTAVLPRDVVIDGGSFARGETVNARYGFPYWRVSWLYDVLGDPAREVAFGLSLQIRSASIAIVTADGELGRVVRDLGPVPVLKSRGRLPVGGGHVFFGWEADGFYAPIRYLNGGRSDVTGAILDATVRWGLELDRGLDAYVGLRYVGGGAEGTSERPDYPGDGYTSNWLHLGVIALGFQVR